MKVAIINFSGNVGKTTLAKQLLARRITMPTWSASRARSSGACRKS